MTKTVLVTGARGFVGVPTVAAFRGAGWTVVAACRSAGSAGTPAGIFPPHTRTPDTGVTTPAPGSYREIAVGELGPETDWREALRGVDVVVHLAARVHQMNDTAADPLAEFRLVNVEGTRRLAEQAAAAGARRFVFVSSIKVNGEATAPGAAFRETDSPDPQDAYGISKYEAEQAAFEVGRRAGIEIVIVRPPLMVGSGVKGNLASLAQAIRRGRPLPLGAITENRRSLLDVRNLADALMLCAVHPAAAGEVFLLSDGVPVSTAELARHIGRATERDPRLVPVPPSCIRLAARLLGKGAAAERLTGSLLIDNTKIRRTLDWTPRHGPHDWEI